MKIRDVQGYCPMGCGPTLHLMPSGLIECLTPTCPDTLAVSRILSDAETEHVVKVDYENRNFDLQHPLRERLDGELFACSLHEELMLIGPPSPRLTGGSGKFRVTPGDAARWNWTRV